MKISNHSKISILILLIALVALGISINCFCSKEKIGYVRNHELVYSFEGMKEANLKYEEETAVWNATIDSMERIFHEQLANYNSKVKELSQDEKILIEKQLERQREHILSVKKKVKQNMEQRDMEITQRVLNQLNDYVKEFALENNYDLIIGTTADGNLMYGVEYLDITDEIIKEVNFKYLN